MTAVFSDVIMNALALLNADSGPVLQDYPVELPDSDQLPPCPVSFKRNRDWIPATPHRGEVASLGPWYELGLQRGRTTVGVRVGIE